MAARRARPLFLLAAFLLATAVTTPCGADDESVLHAYLAGNGLLNRGMYDLAADEYRAFLGAHPHHDKASAARYGLGVCLHRLDDRDGAIEALLPLRNSRRFTFAAEALVILGQCYLARDQPDEAAACFTDALERHPEHDLADDAAAMLVEALYRQGRFADVAEPARRVARDWPDSPLRDRAALFEGLALMQVGRPHEAATRLETFEERFPRSAHRDQVRLLLAQCRHRTKALDRAAEGYRRVIDDGVDRLVPDALYGLGVLRRETGRPAEAAGLLDTLLERYPDARATTAAKLERARADFDRDRYDDAADRFTSLAADPALADQAQYWIAKCDLRRDRPTDAAGRLETTVRRFPRSPLLPEMHYDQAVALVRAGDHAAAAGVLETFAARFGEHALAPDAMQLLASAEHARGRTDRSLALCDAFLAVHGEHPQAAEIAFLRAENLSRAGRDEDAIDAYRVFLTRHDDHPRAARASFRLGATLHAAGRLDEAEAFLRQVVDGRRTLPAHRAAIAALGDIAFERRAWDDAREHFTLYLDLADPGPLAEGARLKRGLAAQRSGHPDEALRDYDTLLATYPRGAHRAQAHFERGQVLVALDRRVEADRAFAAAIEADESDRFRAHALHHRGVLALAAGQADAAAALLDGAVDAGSGSAAIESAYLAGRAHLAAGDYEDAANRFERLAREHSAHARAPASRANLAIALARLDRHDEALAAMATIVDSPLPPDLAATVEYEKAWCLRALGRDAEAADVYRDLVDRDGQRVLASHAALELAELDAAAGRLDEAIERLRRLNDTAADALPAELARECAYRLAVCEYEAGHDAEAAALFDRYLAGDPDPALAPDAALCCGEALYRLGRHGEAAKRFERLLEEHPEADTTRAATLRLAECEAVLQRWARSEGLFAGYLERHPDDDLWFQAQFGLGWARENQRRYDEAIVCYRAVVAGHRGPTAARAQFQIGECLFAGKSYEEAARELLKVDILYAYPEWSAAALYEAGRCFEALARGDEARRHYEQVAAKFEGSRWAQLAAARLAALTGGPLPGRGARGG